MESVTLDRAADGHVWIRTESKAAFKRIRRTLIFRHGFIRWGSWIPPITDEAIFPDYIRWGLRIRSGWDNWVGFDFLAANNATDTFLIAFADKYFPMCENLLTNPERDSENRHS